MAEIKINAKSRDFKTKGELNQARKAGMAPGVYYIKGEDPVSIIVNANDLNPLIYTSENHVVNLSIDEGESILCLLKDVQFDPVSEKVIHFDLYGMTVGEEIEVEVPLNFVGDAIGVKKGGRIQQALHKVNVKCLPKHFPESIEVDLTDLDMGQTITVADLNVENITFLQTEDTLLVSCLAPVAEEEEVVEDEAPVATEPEVIGKGGSDEEE
jgi:large subunit ribosomal protein L25